MVARGKAKKRDIEDIFDSDVWCMDFGSPIEANVRYRGRCEKSRRLIMRCV